MNSIEQRDLDGEGGLYVKLAASHPKLQRGQVWCRTCGYSEQVSASYALKHGWPRHCGYTMTIDAPTTTAPGEG